VRRYRPDQYALPGIQRRAELPAGTVFEYGGRALLVVKTRGTDPAAPVIVEELTDSVSLKGQFGLWSLDGVSRAIRRKR
jgi:hypothetical protein